MEKRTKTLRLETITPALAEIYLRRNIPNNRRKKDRKIESYAADMKCGNWQVDTPDNIIAFDTDGRLINGQNRLQAVIKSGCSIDMWIWDDVPKNVNVFDVGANRSTSDICQLKGLNKDVASRKAVSLVKLLNTYVYPDNVRWTNDMVYDYLSEFGTEVWLSTKICEAKYGRNRLMSNASIQSAVYLAYRYGMHEDDLREFAKVCASGLQNYPWQSSAIILRNYII